ncbi:MAG TPA: glycosyltransferase [Usitatibacter sp.]|nr:glycosyltransferase [Usitatibacter sp.]
MQPPSAARKPVQLHITHDLGGGGAKWLADFIEADSTRTNLVLKSMTHEHAAASAVALYAGAGDRPPLKVWPFRERIPAAVVSHAEYAAALAGIVAEHSVGAILVSSLIGHSLQALETGLPTLVVNHDYFPYCPAVNLYFEAPCAQCDGARVAECHRDNDRFNPFAGFDAQARIAVRERFVELVHRPGVTLVTPSESVAANLRRLDRRFERARFATIPHGYGHPLRRRPAPAPGPGERLRILVLGQLSAPKGFELLREALPRLQRFADLYLMGARELGAMFEGEPHVHVMPRYALEELPIHVANVNPHLGLLMSIVPETFSYTLSELFMLGVPAVATRLGAFAERVRDGENGFLYEPEADAMVALLRRLDADRPAIARARAILEGWQPRAAAEMVDDYHRLAPIAAPAAATSAPAAAAPGAPDGVVAAQAITLADMWKELKRLHLDLSIANEARVRERKDFTFRTESLEHRLETAEQRGKDQGRVLNEKDRQILGLEGQVADLQKHAAQQKALLDRIFASRSWRLMGPLRRAGRVPAKLGLLARCLRGVHRDPEPWGRKLRHLGNAFRAGGMLGLKTSLLGFEPTDSAGAAWIEYRATLEREVFPRIANAIARMSKRPRISVIVPTYNTPEAMLRRTLDSVLAQLYPEWELCVADDGSTEPHVAAVLREYAARDARIKVEVGGANAGVSHASNRALALATGEFTVLLDHDDMLEEHALFRVAESVAADAPDMVYSDEVLLTADGERAIHVVYRPAFSPELLRSHPYIVHLVAFRTALLRELGGFDEALRISQDYDLILRASERARTIVHIPEPLYRWRIHGESAGHQKKAEVMRVSIAALQRHLDRSGLPGRVEEGFGFNFFDTRYALRPGLRVAIIIPTKNHGELLRQCIESIRATVTGVAYEIVVVDHESDDTATLDYLDSVAKFARVLRYEGSFNFSAINNHAVASLEGQFSHYLFCNNDIEAVHAGWLERMLEVGQLPGVGIVGAKLLYPDRKTIQHAGVCVGAMGRAEHYGKFHVLPEDRIEHGYFGAFWVNRDMSAVTAACLLIKSEVFAEVEGFDETIAVGFGDVDLCLRVVEAGHRVVFCPYAELIHHESLTRGISAEDPHPGDSALYASKWRKLLNAGDPYYSPGLSLTSTTWMAKRPLHCSYEVRRRIVRRDPATARQSIAFSTP